MRKRLVLLLFALASNAFAQTALPSGDGKHFQWSRRTAHELDYGQTVRNSNELSSEDKAALLEEIAAQIRPTMAYWQIASEQELHQLAAKTRILLADLNNDGIPEVLAQAMGKAGCGATGNCSFWVFQKVGAKFTKVLDSRGKDGVGGIELITVKPNRTNGFNDIVLATSESGGQRDLYLYQYRGGRYRENGCYVADWVSRTGGTFSEHKYPLITACGQ